LGKIAGGVYGCGSNRWEHRDAAVAYILGGAPAFLSRHVYERKGKDGPHLAPIGGSGGGLLPVLATVGDVVGGGFHAQVPAVVVKAKEMLEAGHCVVIGLQSTGESAAAGAMADKGVDLDDFVSGPRETLLKLIDEYYPLPPHPDARVSDALPELKELNSKVLEAGLGRVDENGKRRSTRTQDTSVRYNTKTRVTPDSESSDPDSSEDDSDEESSESGDSASSSVVRGRERRSSLCLVVL
jgi:hypothetical protein